MPFLNLFKKKEVEDELQQKGVEAHLQQKKEPAKDSSGIILKPHVSEKASQFQQNNEYVFEVFTGATKPMIRAAVSRMYGVNAQRVRIINVRPRKVRVGKFQGTKPGFKKAIVKLAKGQKIESLSASP